MSESAVERVFDDFLQEFRRSRWVQDDLPAGIDAVGRYQAANVPMFEVALATADHRLRADEVRTAWRRRHGGRAARVLLVVGVAGSAEATVAGLDDSTGGVPVERVPWATVERVAARALEAADSREIDSLIDALFAPPDDLLPPGLRNQGLFTAQSLVTTVRQRADWPAAAQHAMSLAGRRGLDVLTTLGWTFSQEGDDVLLREGRADRAVAVLLAADELFDRPSFRFGLGVSPVEHALQVARAREVAWVLALRGGRIRLYAADPRKPVFRGSSTGSYAEVDLDLLGPDDAAFAWLFFTPAALRADGVVDEVLADSREHAAGLAERLRERVYVEVVPGLAETIARHHFDLTEEGLRRAYHQTLVVLFRLLFVAYAEDRRLLPYRANAAYTRQALRTVARELADRDPSTPFDPRSTDLWDGLVAIWGAVREGNRDWGVPAYGGTIFRQDNPTGTALAALRLTNAEIGPVLTRLLVDSGTDGARGPVDFRALSVRDFGTIYEGLLESSLSVAATDLALDDKQAFIPAGGRDDVVVPAGSVYFHNASGARKSTGSYFTKEFAVEHLVSSALEPTLAEHLDRVAAALAAGRDADAGSMLFDFHVADIAMGSGHFLVTAVDHISRAMDAFLAAHDVPAVRQELGVLHEAAVNQLADVGVALSGPEAPQITQSDLLRRQVAKRCVYGVDINEIAVDLAQLALWIHTFVPGLPMSDLSHTLAHGNSLTGIGTVDELLGLLDVRGSFVEDEIAAGQAAADDDLARAALLAETSVAESDKAQAMRAEAAQKVAPMRAVCDLAVASRLGVVSLPELAMSGWDALVAVGGRRVVRERVEPLNPLHFPVAFPEVFRSGRRRQGFDVVLGNPPWDEAMVEEPKFWQRYEAGVMGLAPAPLRRRITELRAARPDLVDDLKQEQERVAAVRDVLLSGPYPGLGTGDVDYYKAFSWRYWHLLAKGGRSGTVFPRSLLNAAGSALWREEVLGASRLASVVSLSNTGKWVFPDVHGQYTIVLLTLEKTGDPAATVGMAGPFHSRAAFDAGCGNLAPLSVEKLLTWGNGATFPLLPTTQSAEIFEVFRRHPRFDAPGPWEYRPVREFDATNDRSTFDAGEGLGRWPVLTGASFSHWDPDFGDPYAWADPATVIDVLFRKRQRQVRNRRTAFFGLAPAAVNDRGTLPCRHARIVFRDVTNQTNTRTVVAALAPPDVVLTNAAPYLLRACGSAGDDAYVLGVLSSIPLDWYARRYVELHVNIHILNAFPVPRPGPADPLRRRVVEIAGRLAAVDARYGDWAREVGVPVGSVVNQRDKDDLVAELDAVVAHLYGLSRSDLVHVFETFHRGWDYAPRLTATLAHFDRWLVP